MPKQHRLRLKEHSALECLTVSICSRSICRSAGSFCSLPKANTETSQAGASDVKVQIIIGEASEAIRLFVDCTVVVVNAVAI